MNGTGPDPSVRTIWHIGYFVVGVVFAHVIGFAGAVLLQRAGIPSRASFVALTATAVLIVSRVATRRLEGVSPRALGLGWDRPWLSHLIAGSLAGVGLVAGVSSSLTALDLAETTLNLGTSHQVPRLVLGFIFCAGIAVYEGLLFRGFAFQLLARHSVTLAIVLSGIAFVAMHLPQPGGSHPLALLNGFVAHMFFAACYLRTRSLWFPIALHTVWNYAEGFLLGMPLRGRNLTAALAKTELTESVWSGYAFGANGGLIVTIVLIVAGTVVVRLLPRKRPPDDLAARLASPIDQRSVVASYETVERKPRAKRILAIDVLRGTALLGILPMNMQIFTTVGGGFFYPYATEYTDTANLSVWVALRVLIGNKDLSLFSLLFGAGLILSAGARRDGAESPIKTHFRRMAVLWAIGLLHAYLIWSGDILVTYAIVGVAVYFLRNLSPKLLILLGACGYAVPLTLLLLAHVLVPKLGVAGIEAVVAQFDPSESTTAEYYRAYLTGWFDQMGVRAKAAFANQTIALFGAMGWIAGGMMLIGMGLQRLGIFSGAGPTRAHVFMIGVTALFGYPLLVYSFWFHFAGDWTIPGTFFVGLFMREAAYGIIVFGWVGAVVLLCRYWNPVWITGPLAAIGKMSLSNYLAQSLAMSLIFNGHGLGLMGKLDNIAQIYTALLIGATQLAVSTLWLRRFRLGPVEWLWRSLVDMRWQRWT